VPINFHGISKIAGTRLLDVTPCQEICKEALYIRNIILIGQEKRVLLQGACGELESDQLLSYWTISFD